MSRSDQARRSVIQRLCAEAGLEWIEIGAFPPTADGGRAAAEALLQTATTAVLVYNDLMALALMERLRSYGVDIPGQISVVGWDDIPFSAMVTPALATIRVPRYDMGVRAIDMLHGAAAAGEPSATDGDEHLPAHIALATQFVPRGSIARPDGADVTA